jgi:hypothetical protein
MDSLKKENLIRSIDPYKAVDLMGHRWITFNQPDTLKKADQLLKNYLAAHQEKRKTILDYLTDRNGKT